ncbi:helix-turn-helix transcriptional regulator [Austwickia chelonae]|uniref:helix-turn-helix transcriptional regulator n=1 Tax=Austwickia chelonae TaxID=100225 RepID=UPI0013C31C38|nr:helix-turn-helix domain-containing protein [Austwickia chelonae]
MKSTPGLGPASTPLTPLGDARLRVLRALRAHQGHPSDDTPERAPSTPATAARLAEHLGLHPNGIRRHLDALNEEGLVATTTIDTGRRGRPCLGYTLTAQGDAALAGAQVLVSAAYLAMAGSFAHYVATSAEVPEREADLIGRHWGTTLARQASPSRGDTESRLIDLLDDLGFSPRRRGPRELELHTCPLLSTAQEYPEVLCRVHLGLVRGASAAYGGPGEGGDLRPFAEPGACLLRLPGQESLSVQPEPQSEPNRSRV